MPRACLSLQNCLPWNDFDRIGFEFVSLSVLLFQRVLGKVKWMLPWACAVLNLRQELQSSLMGNWKRVWKAVNINTETLETPVSRPIWLIRWILVRINSLTPSNWCFLYICLCYFFFRIVVRYYYQNNYFLHSLRFAAHCCFDILFCYLAQKQKIIQNQVGWLTSPSDLSPNFRKLRSLAFSLKILKIPRVVNFRLTLVRDVGKFVR